MEASPFCPFAEKLRHLYLIIFSNVLRKLILQEMERQNENGFVEFLNKHREVLFHLKGRYCCCGDNKQRNSILTKDQWNNLFMVSTTHAHCQYRTHNIDCFHTYEAHPWLTVENEVVDFSLLCVLLRNICDSKYKKTIETVQLNRNEVIHNGKSRLSEGDFEILWSKAMISLSEVALYVSKESEEQAIKEAGDIYNYKEKLARYIGKFLLAYTKKVYNRSVCNGLIIDSNEETRDDSFFEREI